MPNPKLKKESEQKITELKNKIQELNKENKFFELLIRSLPGLFYLFDSNFNVYRWNKNVETVTGYSTNEIQTKNLLELFEDDDLIKIKTNIEEAFVKGDACIEASLLPKDGIKIPYFWTGASTNIENVSYLIGVGIDISKRIQAEKDLRESENFYRILADRMTEGIVLFHNFRIIFANNSFATMFGYDKPSQLNNKNIMDMIAEEFDLYFREMYEAILCNVCEERFFQARWMNKIGKEIWVEGRTKLINWKGQPTILLTARDITETKLREISMQKETDNLRRENVRLRSSIKDRYRLGEIIGKSEAMQKVYTLILNAAASNANVVIFGESGTGKELVARAVHKMSRRASKSFVPVNSSAIPENLLESEFFGHKKGAFTGANSDKSGYLDLANGGTLFLDEVGDLNPSLQAKLLRALEDGSYSPIGSSIIKESDFRVLSATHKDLIQQVKIGEMREDFFYRIHIIPINLPPLRERKDDIPLLVEHFLKIYSNDKKTNQLSGHVMEVLMQYDFPGNVRELQNIIQRYLAVKSIDFLHIDNPPELTIDNSLNLQDNIDHIEQKMIKEALIKSGGKKSNAAKSLGISRKTLARKIKRFDL